MRSTGEVMGVAANLGMALAKAQEATGAALPTGGSVFVSVANRDKRSIVLPVSRLEQMGFRILATKGTASVLARAGVAVTPVAKRSEGVPSAPDLIGAGEVQLVINTPFGRGPRTDGYLIRTAAVRAGVPCITTIPGVIAAVQGIEAVAKGPSEQVPLQVLHAAAGRGEPARGDEPGGRAEPSPLVVADAGLPEGVAQPTLIASGGGPSEGVSA
jgi:carbamoyl-phosphate synthase large subunit